ncbi:MAG: citrate lyase acyl carrier protein [Synergistales bacterium]|nr:citrate lyase acyl carrier protein [Synergistales bacterium]
MEISGKTAQAGTLESGDILITITLGEEDKGIEIELESPSQAVYGQQIYNTITGTLNDLGVRTAYVKAQDRGALDCTISARVEAAALRALKK